MIRAMVMTHGDIGRELVRVTEMILGPITGLTARTNHGKSAADITAEIKIWLEDGNDPGREGGSPSGGNLILLDDYGGSCATSAQLACGPNPNTAIVSGVNLAMLLGFATWRDSGGFDDLVARIVQKGREAIILVGRH